MDNFPYEQLGDRAVLMKQIEKSFPWMRNMEAMELTQKMGNFWSHSLKPWDLSPAFLAKQLKKGDFSHVIRMERHLAEGKTGLPKAGDPSLAEAVARNSGGFIPNFARPRF